MCACPYYYAHGTTLIPHQPNAVAVVPFLDHLLTYTRNQPSQRQWPARTVDDIDGQLSQQLRQLERETVEVLLSWETRATQQEEEGKKDKAKAAAGPAPSSSSNKGGGKGLSLWGAMKKAVAPAVAPSKPATAIDPTSRGYLSTLQLVRT